MKVPKFILGISSSITFIPGKRVDPGQAEAVLLGDVPERVPDLPVEDPPPPELATAPRDVKLPPKNWREKMQRKVLSIFFRNQKRNFFTKDDSLTNLNILFK